MKNLILTILTSGIFLLGLEANAAASDMTTQNLKEYFLSLAKNKVYKANNRPEYHQDTAPAEYAYNRMAYYQLKSSDVSSYMITIPYNRSTDSQRAPIAAEPMSRHKYIFAPVQFIDLEASEPSKSAIVFNKNVVIKNNLVGAEYAKNGTFDYINAFTSLIEENPELKVLASYLDPDTVAIHQYVSLNLGDGRSAVIVSPINLKTINSHQDLYKAVKSYSSKSNYTPQSYYEHLEIDAYFFILDKDKNVISKHDLVARYYTNRTESVNYGTTYSPYPYYLDLDWRYSNLLNGAVTNAELMSFLTDTKLLTSEFMQSLPKLYTSHLYSLGYDRKDVEQKSQEYFGNISAWYDLKNKLEKRIVNSQYFAPEWVEISSAYFKSGEQRLIRSKDLVRSHANDEGFKVLIYCHIDFLKSLTKNSRGYIQLNSQDASKYFRIYYLNGSLRELSRISGGMPQILNIDSLNLDLNLRSQPVLESRIINGYEHTYPTNLIGKFVANLSLERRISFEKERELGFKTETAKMELSIHTYNSSGASARQNLSNRAANESKRVGLEFQGNRQIKFDETQVSAYQMMSDYAPLSVLQITHPFSPHTSPGLGADGNEFQREYKDYSYNRLVGQMLIPSKDQRQIFLRSQVEKFNHYEKIFNQTAPTTSIHTPKCNDLFK